MSELTFSYGSEIGPFRISIIIICVIVLVAFVVVHSIFASKDKRTYSPPPDEAYGKQPKVQT